MTLSRLTSNANMYDVACRMIACGSHTTLAHKVTGLSRPALADLYQEKTGSRPKGGPRKQLLSNCLISREAYYAMDDFLGIFEELRARIEQPRFLSIIQASEIFSSLSSYAHVMDINEADIIAASLMDGEITIKSCSRCGARYGSAPDVNARVAIPASLNRYCRHCREIVARQGGGNSYTKGEVSKLYYG